MTKEQHQQRTEALKSKYPSAFTECADSSALRAYPGWYSLIETALSEATTGMSNEELSYFRIFSIREKYGSLQIDTNAPDEAPFTKAEDLSEQTCMLCEAPAKQWDDEWIVTLCDHHRELTMQGMRLETDFEVLTTLSSTSIT